MINQTAPDTTDEQQEIFDHEEDITALKQKSVSGVVSFFMRTFFLQAIGLVSAFALSAFLNPEDFGIYGFVTQIIGILVFFSDVGLAAALIQKKQQPSLHDYRTAFTIQQMLSWFIVACVTMVIASGAVARVAGEQSSAANWVLIALALSFPLATFKTVSSIKLERQLLFSKMVIPQIVEQVVFHGLLIYLAWQGMGVMAYAYAIIARSVLGTVIMFGLQPWSIGLALNKAAFKELMNFGLKFQLNDFLARIKDQLFFMVLGFFLPLREFGYVTWAKNYSVYPYTLTVQNVTAITFPTFSRLQEHKALLARAIEKSIFFISVSIFPILVGMCIFIIPLVQLIEKYHKWEPAILSLVLFTLSIGWGAISTPLTNTLNAIGQIDRTLKLMVMWTTLTWILTPLLVWYFGFNGVALASFVISFTSVLPIYYVKKIVSVDIWGQVWHALSAALVMAMVGIAGLSVWQLSFMHMFGGMVISSAAYGIVLAAIGREKITAEVKSLLAMRKQR